MPDNYLSPKTLIDEIKTDGQIAYTYSEPLVHAEYLIDCMEEAKKKGAANVLVTNGCINPEAAEEILSRTDAANIDLKCFSEKTYRNILGGNLETVLDFIRLALSLGVHIEITTLIVPDLNDSEAELMEIAGFIAELNTKNAVPWHVSAYHPDWKWDAPPTEPGVLVSIAKKAKCSLPYVYTGNIIGENNNTACTCGALLVKRRGYHTDISGLRLPPGCSQDKMPVYYHCAECGNETPVRYW